MTRVLVIEKICKLNTSFMCEYFLGKQNLTGRRLLHQLVDLLLQSRDYGVQTSVASILNSLLARDVTTNVLLWREFHIDGQPNVHPAVLHGLLA